MLQFQLRQLSLQSVPFYPQLVAFQLKCVLGLIHLLSEEGLKLLTLLVKLGQLVPAEVVEVSHCSHSFDALLTEELFEGCGVFSHALVVVVGFVKSSLECFPFSIELSIDVLKFAVLQSEILILLAHLFFLGLLILGDAI